MYDEIDLEDMSWSPGDRTFYYPCPCGDKFFISLVRGATRQSRQCFARAHARPAPSLRPLSQDDLLNGEDVAPCPSCSLRIRVIFADADALDARVQAEELRLAG